MVDDEIRFKQTIGQKCAPCFRKADCMLYAARHAGIELCLGPFEDQEDRINKLKEDFDREIKHPDINRLMWEITKNAYARKKKLFDDR